MGRGAVSGSNVIDARRLPMPADEAPRTGALSPSQMLAATSRQPGYRATDATPAVRHAAVVQRLWGGRLTPMMAGDGVPGRLAGATLSCPQTACTGMLTLPPRARSAPWRSPAAIENLVCLDGPIEVRFGASLEHTLTLGRYDMVSLPADVRHELVNPGDADARAVLVLSVAAGDPFDAVFATALAAGVPAEAAAALGVHFEDADGPDARVGRVVDAQAVTSRVTRFAELVPYKSDLSRTGGLPPEATASLSAGSVFPLIVPEGHVGRSRTAPMYGNQGLYISIAECSAGDDGPPPHSHSDTQESFFVLDGGFDICTGFDNEAVVSVQPGDLVSVPKGVMRTFRNTSGAPARLLVIIQGPDRMQDTVSYSRRIGADFERRFGPEAIEAYARIRMTFDAENRLDAAALPGHP
jgi:quercetin dioxygenase-like cupin family protein